MPAWIGSEDVLILNLLLSARRHGVSRLYLKGTSGGQALNNMLATGRCFWEESRIPFSQGDAISPRFVWQDIDEDHKQLCLELSECDNWELIPTVPPAYIALDYFKIGPLDTEMSIDKLVLLTQMPPVPCSQLEAVSLQLTKHFPANIVPMPLNLDVIECHAPLTVRLTLGSYPLAQFAAPQPLVLLEFVYQEVVLSGRHVPQAISLVTQGEIHYQVTRQLVLENEATNRLMALGFIALEPSQLRNGDPSTSLWTLGPLPECIEPWFAFIERGVPALAAQGYQVNYRDDFSLNVKDTPLAIELDDSQDGWFSLSLNADIEGQSIPMLPLIAAWLRQHGEPNDDA
ncbi:MAG: DEAD/DEAH box helicase, partial [Shewanella sp.]